MKMQKFAVCAASVVALLAAVAQPLQAKEWTQITIGVEGAFPPYNSTSADGKVVGYDIDVANEMCKRANLKCNVVAQGFGIARFRLFSRRSSTPS